MASITEINSIRQPGWQTCPLDRVLGLVRLDQVSVAVEVDGRFESHSEFKAVRAGRRPEVAGLQMLADGRI